MNTTSSSGSGTLPGNTITNPKEELKGITTRSGTAYQGPTIPTTSSSLPPVVERETEATKDMVPPTNNGSIKTPLLVSAPKPNQRPSIPYPSRLHDQKLRDKANDQREIFPNFKDLNFNISFADALILMPIFCPTIKTLLTNKDKLSELARTLLNEHCLVVLLKKLPEQLGDPGKFLILCDFPGMAECLALTDLGTSINLIPLSVWNKLSLHELYPMCMTLTLINRLISHPVGVTEDVFVKVGTFHFPADFFVVDFDADPRVPLILGRSFLKTERALIDVFKGELTLRVGKEAITFNLNQTLRYTANYNDMTANRIDIIDMACEEYSQEVLSFSNVIAISNPTPYYDPIVSTSSPTLTPFRGSDFLLEEVELKDLPPHLEYAFLEGGDKLPVIIAKYLSVEEKTTLITVLKSHKRAIAWKLSVNKAIDPEFCTHKILMEDDFEPAVQHHRRVNPKIHNVIKNKVLKLLDDGLIYSIFDSPWTKRALIDLFEGELTLCVGKEAIAFNLDQTSRYSANYNDMTANRIDVIDMDCEEYSQEVPGFFDVIASRNPTPYYDPIVSTSSPTLTPFGDIDFLLEEVDAFLALEDDPTFLEVDHSYVDTEGDIPLLKAFLNDDTSLPPPNQGNYLPQVRKEHKICEAKTDKSLIDEPLEVELKDLPPHLEYTFLEGDDKLPVIIAKDLSVEEKTALMTVLKSHKRAIAWNLSDIK
nr:reverse transcriptase domain-containing protein [Tanacetum cinerariifolium]